MALSGENHALTDFSARSRRVERGRLSRGICLRDIFARKTQKGTGWERALKSPSNPFAYTASHDSRKREYGNRQREGKRERERETYWPRQAVSGLPILRALLVDPYEANYTSPKAPHLHPRPTFPGRVLFSLGAVIGSAARTSYIRYRCKSIYLVRYSAHDSRVILVCVI